jgi:hypothetical protein
MSVRLIVLSLVIAAFGVLTSLALLDVGYLGILAPHFRSWGEGQVLADLVILGVLGCLWIGADARQHGLPAWPFILMTVVLGSFGVLFYLVAREFRAPVARSVSQPV